MHAWLWESRYVHCEDCEQVYFEGYITLILGVTGFRGFNFRATAYMYKEILNDKYDFTRVHASYPRL